MIRENKVSLWLGVFENADEFKSFISISYDDDGNYIPSAFQEAYGIRKYDLEAIEADWIEERCYDVETLLLGFSGDSEIIPKFKKLLEGKKLQEYNSIILLYNFEYDIKDCINNRLEFIGVVDVSLYE